MLALRQVLALAGAIDGRYHAPILLAVFGSLRWAELAALRRCDIDLEARTVRIFRQLAESPGGGSLSGRPSPRPDSGPSCFLISSCLILPGTSRDSSALKMTACSSRARVGARRGTLTSAAGCGSRPWLILAWLTFIFTIFVMQAMSWRQARARTCAS